MEVNDWSKSLEHLPSFDIRSISDWIGPSARPLKRGYQFFIEDYVHEIFTKRGDSQSFICKGKCWPSQRKTDKPHNLTLEMKQSTPVIQKAKCTCKAGLGGKCSHITALLYKMHHFHIRDLKRIPGALSCTSTEQQWHKPRGDTIVAEPVTNCIFARAETDRTKVRAKSPIKSRRFDARSKGLKRPLLESEVEAFATCSASNAPFSYLLKNHDGSNDNVQVDTAFGKVKVGSALSYQMKSLISSEEQVNTSVYVSNIAKASFRITIATPIKFPNLPLLSLNYSFEEFHEVLDGAQKDLLFDLYMSLQEAHALEEATTSQSQSTLWHNSRKRRLTSSNFGKVIKRKTKASTSFLKSIFEAPKLDHVPAVRHGLSKEKHAVRTYCEEIKKQLNRDVKIFDSGLIVNPGLNILGASPDGKVFDKYETGSNFGLLEVKCPFKYRNNCVQEAALNDDFCLHFDDDKLKLKTTHNYFYQVQGQMALSGLPWCDFAVYTSKSLFIERIRFDIVFWTTKMVPSLANFYFSFALPYLAE